MEGSLIFCNPLQKDIMQLVCKDVSGTMYSRIREGEKQFLSYEVDLEKEPESPSIEVKRDKRSKLWICPIYSVVKVEEMYLRSPEIVTMALFAIAVHNFKKKNDVKFVKMVKAIQRNVTGYLYLLTFDAIDSEGRERTFRTTVHDMAWLSYWKATPLIDNEKALSKMQKELMSAVMKMPC
ncbi:hypothetical protein AQUCO_03000277v1 [Aquilegia coerulea]|uniref:Cystatin domain-containing protein n=1 Tax=Aquilegia coerulea TaxID=218851 RepID=A0A2G5D262_AQUCA|nr:hypothetical protein AQUCO_03000277v1 [Aquilegia coerulea]